MVARRTIGMLAFSGAAAGGAALAWMARQRRADAALQDDPEWAELQRPIRGDTLTVESFDGTSLHVETLGSDGSPVIVFAHGYALSQHAWHYQRRDLAGEFRLVFYDQRGHGGSEEAVSGDYSASALGRDLGRVIDEAVPEDRPVVLAGHSLGGMSVLAFAEQFPEFVGQRLAGVVLVNTAGGGLLAGAVPAVGGALLRGLWPIPIGATPRRFLSRVTEQAHRMVWGVSLGPKASPAEVAYTERLVVAAPNSVKAALAPTLSGLDLEAAAATLRVPTVVLAGTRDGLIPGRQAHRLVELLPGATLIELPDVGHMAPLEAHETVTGQIRELARRVLVEAA